MQLYNRMTAQVLAFPWLCDWENIMVIQISIKLYWQVMFSITPSLKQIGFQVSWHKKMLTIHSIKSCQQSSLPWTVLVQNKCSMIFNKWTGCVNTNWISSKLTAKFLRKKILNVLISHTTLTLNEGQGHPNWHQNVVLWLPSSNEVWKRLVCKCLNTNIPMKSCKYGSLPWILRWTRFITLTSLNSMPNSIQIDWKLSEVTATEVSAFLHSCDLDSTLNLSDTVSKTAVISLLSLNLTQKQFQNVQLKLLQHHIQISSWSAEKCGRKWSQYFALYPPGKVKVFGSGIKWRKSMVPRGTAGMKKSGLMVCV